MADLAADPLIWGRGATRLEMFLEPTCPFSARAFGKIEGLLDRAGDRMTVRIWLHSQPWHLLSPILCRAIVGASTLEGGRETARRLMATIFDHRAEFAFENHAAGPNRRRSPDDILARMSELGGLDATAAFERDGVESLVKHHAKYGRQNGIHASPTVMVNGLVREDIESDAGPDDWIARILG